MLFTADNALEVETVALAASGVVDLSEDGFVTRDYENGVLCVDISNQKKTEEEVFRVSV